jgi:2-polyprenyl-3-methyl-5-hydroxy-6-metoxy-1,4-benzoquinol methylase
VNDVTHYPDSPRAEMQRFIPADAQRVLDVGCHTGAFGHALKQARRIEVWGVEPAREPAAVAATRLDHVLAEELGADSPLPERHFDAIVFNDVLEHMTSPWDMLELAQRWLAPHGVVVISLPNLLHVDNLEHMLFERDFRYEGRGVRDRTHLRFFTRKSALRMIESCGYTVTECCGINESWWSPSLARRAAFRLFARWLDEFKPQQFAFVARLD